MNVCKNHPEINRRIFLTGAGASAAAIPLIAPTAPSVGQLVEQVMATIVPSRGGFVQVSQSHLEALCEACDVEFADHWADRREVM